MHRLHGGHAANAAAFSLNGIGRLPTLHVEGGDEFLLLSSYLPVGLGPSFCSASFFSVSDFACNARRIIAHSPPVISKTAELKRAALRSDSIADHETVSTNVQAEGTLCNGACCRGVETGNTDVSKTLKRIMVMTRVKSLLATTALMSAFALPAAALVLDTSAMVGMVAPPVVAGTTSAENSTGPATGDSVVTETDAAAAAAVIARTADPESAFIGDTVTAADGEMIGSVESALVDAADGGTTLVVNVDPSITSPVTQFTIDIPGGSESDGTVVVAMSRAELIGILENNM